MYRYEVGMSDNSQKTSVQPKTTRNYVQGDTSDIKVSEAGGTIGRKLKRDSLHLCFITTAIQWMPVNISMGPGKTGSSGVYFWSPTKLLLPEIVTHLLGVLNEVIIFPYKVIICPYCFLTIHTLKTLEGSWIKLENYNPNSRSSNCHSNYAERYFGCHHPQGSRETMKITIKPNVLSRSSKGLDIARLHRVRVM